MQNIDRKNYDDEAQVCQIRQTFSPFKHLSHMVLVLKWNVFVYTATPITH